MCQGDNVRRYVLIYETMQLECVKFSFILFQQLESMDTE